MNPANYYIYLFSYSMRLKADIFISYDYIRTLKNRVHKKVYNKKLWIRENRKREIYCLMTYFSYLPILYICNYFIKCLWQNKNL